MKEGSICRVPRTSIWRLHVGENARQARALTMKRTETWSSSQKQRRAFWVSLRKQCQATLLTACSVLKITFQALRFPNIAKIPAQDVTIEFKMQSKAPRSPKSASKWVPKWSEERPRRFHSGHDFYVFLLTFSKCRFGTPALDLCKKQGQKSTQKVRWTPKTLDLSQKYV